MSALTPPADAAALAAALAGAGYIAEPGLAMALWLAISLGRPLLLEGEAGTGKTAIAQALAQALPTRLIRLQCYEGLDAAQALYEWNYPRQLLALKTLDGLSLEQAESTLFSDRYLLRRPLLEAICQPEPPVLLIDEIDRADEAFEAFLLEILAEFQVTIPELGTLQARSRPMVVLTSNGTRALSDALRRRCLYSWVEFPEPERERQILAARLPGLDAILAGEVARFVAGLRREDLEKKPGIAESLDWAQALLGLRLNRLPGDAAQIQPTLVCLLKTAADQAQIRPEVTARLLGQAAAA